MQRNDAIGHAHKRLKRTAADFYVHCSEEEQDQGVDKPHMGGSGLAAEEE